jgi:hypothetical protein
VSAHARVQGAHSSMHATRAGDFEIEMPPPLPMGDLPPALAATLQHVVGKLDMMTQARFALLSSLFVERSLNLCCA